jgi:hypothetical protein
MMNLQAGDGSRQEYCCCFWLLLSTPHEKTVGGAMLVDFGLAAR